MKKMHLNRNNSNFLLAEETLTFFWSISDELHLGRGNAPVFNRSRIYYDTEKANSTLETLLFKVRQNSKIKCSDVKLTTLKTRSQSSIFFFVRKYISTDA